MKAIMRTRTWAPILAAVLLLPPVLSRGEEKTKSSIFAKDNLVAWCIVPFDAAKRGPEERAAMLERLGIRKLAYDWREKDIPTFDVEIDALRRHGIELTAFWIPSGLEPEKERHAGIILGSSRAPRREDTDLGQSVG